MTDSSPQASRATREETASTLRGLIILPAFNESASVAGVVHELARELPGFDLLVVDDGSTDATAERVPYPANVVRLPFNLGIGGAMQTGYRYAAMYGYDLAIQVDADGQHPPTQVRQLLDHQLRTGADMVIGSRFLEPGSYQQTATRMSGMILLRSLLTMLTRQRFSDCTSGFRLATRNVIGAFAHWYPDDYPEPEVVLLLHRAGFRIEEVPTKMAQRTTGQSSISLGKGLFYVLKVSMSLILDMVRAPWPKEALKGK